MRASKIASIVGLSRERVRQILKDANLATKINVLADISAKELRSEYKCWWSMLDRCNNPQNKKFHNYGGRGIKVCRRWQFSFANFVGDMGKKPKKEDTIERLNNNLGYSPSNCIWASKKEQAHNMRTTKLSKVKVEKIKKLLLQGRQQTAIANIFGVSQTTISRIFRGTSW